MTTGILLVVEITKAVSETFKQPLLSHHLAFLFMMHNPLFVLFVYFYVSLLFFFAGVPEILMLNMSKLVVSVLATVKGRDPLASEVIFCLLSFFQEI